MIVANGSNWQDYTIIGTRHWSCYPRQIVVVGADGAIARRWLT
jgi:hypothetical protein